MNTMRVGLGQFNAVVGDLAGNADKMRQMYARAVKADVDLLAFPELAVCGYPPEDLLYKQHFLRDCSMTLEKLAADCPNGNIIAAGRRARK
jgi:predicted amidohydrolase